MSNSPAASGQPGKQDDLILAHADLVKKIAYHLVGRLPPSVDVDDLIQAGMIGLIEATEQFEEKRGVKFETYASIRIRGAMLDELRKINWTPRSVYRNARRASEAIRQVENERGSDASDAEIAARMNVSLDEYYRILQEAQTCQLLSLDQLESNEDGVQEVVASESPDPLDDLEEQDFRQTLAEEIANLPERERLVMSLYYDEELNLKEIGLVLGVSESRVCQIHGKALLRLKSRLSQQQFTGFGNKFDKRVTREGVCK
ncbi:MAG: RNA polymerase sigma factor FliA [Gammaproteobacteria bacterium]|nr:RNA polymerase sigma factor FliA [Gammaproteobacteria bacterium]